MQYYSFPFIIIIKSTKFLPDFWAAPKFFELHLKTSSLNCTLYIVHGTCNMAKFNHQLIVVGWMLKCSKYIRSILKWRSIRFQFNYHSNDSFSRSGKLRLLLHLFIMIENNITIVRFAEFDSFFCFLFHWAKAIKLIVWNVKSDLILWIQDSFLGTKKVEHMS